MKGWPGFEQFLERVGAMAGGSEKSRPLREESGQA